MTVDDLACLWKSMWDSKGISKSVLVTFPVRERPERISLAHSSERNIVQCVGKDAVADCEVALEVA